MLGGGRWAKLLVQQGDALGQNAKLRGVALMLAAMSVLPLVDVCAKFLGQGGIPVVPIVCAIYISIRERASRVTATRDFERP